MAPRERHHLLSSEWIDTTQPVSNITLPGLFESQVERSAGTKAVIFEGKGMSYAKINAQANRLAHLLATRGIGPESYVALALPRSTELIIAILATIKTGAAYMPIDLAYPIDRIEF